MAVIQLPRRVACFAVVGRANEPICLRIHHVTPGGSPIGATKACYLVNAALDACEERGAHFPLHVTGTVYV